MVSARAQGNIRVILVELGVTLGLYAPAYECAWLYRDTIDRAALAEFLSLPGLPKTWPRMAETRRARGFV
ncbi:hypothetical protein DDZ14_13775 [Maritimibacter sp. 55A14]|uniref:3-alpha domain-containing protein n=1 Tax=Maritimibacter sp. 55A14 TaxID=2174844 RepID=UPI000D6202EA|nr:hypothetical protein DDZ14_13775 [Maritimibacter sp. 55A14]